MGRLTSLRKIQATSWADLDRLQDHLREVLQPVLQNPMFASADFRWNEIAGNPPTFALQYRTPGTQTWTSIATLSSVGDLSTAIAKSLLTATGDLIYASAASTPARLAAATNGQLLTLSAGAPAWAGDTAWTAFTFTNSWVNNSAGTQENGAYFKGADGAYKLRGVIKSPGTVGASAIATLPAAPLKSLFPGRVYFPAAGGTGTLQLQIASGTGVLSCNTSTAINDVIDLDGITFDTR